MKKTHQEKYVCVLSRDDERAASTKCNCDASGVPSQTDRICISFISFPIILSDFFFFFLYHLRTYKCIIQVFLFMYTCPQMKSLLYI